MTAPRFKFTLQRILALRQRTEHEAALTLAAAMHAEDAARLSQTEAEARRAEGLNAMRPSAHGSAVTVGELRALAALVQGLEAQANTAGEVMKQASTRVSAQHLGFSDAVRERQTLDRLRSHKEDAWRIEASREDRFIMDEIARARRRADAATDDATRDFR